MLAGCVDVSFEWDFSIPFFCLFCRIRSGSHCAAESHDLRFVHNNHAVRLRMSSTTSVIALAGNPLSVEYPLNDGYLSHYRNAPVISRGGDSVNVTSSARTDTAIREL